MPPSSMNLSVSDENLLRLRVQPKGVRKSQLGKVSSKRKRYTTEAKLGIRPEAIGVRDANDVNSASHRLPIQYSIISRGEINV